MMTTLIGKVTHYYDKIGVAVLELLKPLKSGDTIMFSGHGQEFTQEVASLQIEHKEVKRAKKGESVGLKTDRKVKDGDKVYLKK